MSPPPDSRPVLFVNTGVQILCFPLRPEIRYSAEQVGQGWQYCVCRGVDAATQKEGSIQYGYLQWQVLGRRLFLAVDTTVGADEGEPIYFASQSNLAGDVPIVVRNLLDLKGRPLPGLPPLEFVIRPTAIGAGEDREVHMVVDFGNSRTNCLLVEFRGAVHQPPIMTPLRMVNRFQLDAWDERGQWDSQPRSFCFSSRSHWCTTPYQPPPTLYVTEYQKVLVDRPWWQGGPYEDVVPVAVRRTPETFQDLSQMRMGRETDDLAGVMNVEGDVRTGVSSPKRYLWANDANWLEGANWQMADPFERYVKGQHATTLKGPLLRFISERDEALLPTPVHPEAPLEPRHAPRTTMTGALYEMLAQAFAFVNSPAYGGLTGDHGRKRVLTSLVLTYPSGMIAPERAQLQAQARKAIAIFMQTVGRGQTQTPDLFSNGGGANDVVDPTIDERLFPQLKLSLDEASSVHLTYLWSECRKLAGRPALWFSVMGRQVVPPPPDRPAANRPAANHPFAAPSGANRPGPNRPGAVPPVGRRVEEPAARSEVRIACIDIGGGTSDLMIAAYHCETREGGDRILGETLHRDGISSAGDQLVKRLLERIIVPHFIEVVGMERHDAQLLFGPEVPVSRQLRRLRIHWMNRLFVPLAQAYLEAAVHESDARISHTDPEIVAPEVLQSLQDAINRLWKAGRYNVKQDLNLWYGRTEFEGVVDEVFGTLIYDFCESIVEHKADVVLLAGLPSKIPYIRQLVETYLPMPKSRIVPMYGRYAGAWYPYQNPDATSPGVIVDPKSTVVVGAAVYFSAMHGMLPRIHFDIADTAAKASFHWGVMNEGRIDGDWILFAKQSAGQTATVERRPVKIHVQTTIIGRKRRDRDDSQASPIYILRVLRGKPLKEIDLDVTFERRRDDAGEEMIAVEEVEGTVDGQPAVLGVNVLFEWRTLAEESYYLDTGALDKIEMF